MRRAALFAGILIGFAAITIVLTWFWTEWGRQAYGQFLRAVAPTIYDWIGFGDARVGAFRQRYINFIPFVGLVLVTPGIALTRRAAGLAAGLVALFFGHLGLNLTERLQPGAHLPFVPSLISDALPFVLWVVIAWPALAPYLPKLETNEAAAMNTPASDASASKETSTPSPSTASPSTD